MLKKALLFILPAILCYLQGMAQNPWFTLKADNQVSVKFPAKPAKKPGGAYAYANKDSSVVLLLEIHTRGDNDTSESSILDEFFKNDDNKEEVTPTDQKYDTGEWNGYPTITSGITLGKRRIYNYSVIINGRGYMLGAILTGEADVKIKDTFFTSVKLKK